MADRNPGVDNFLINGCGRCSLGGTPECKVNDWQEELILLREILLEHPLEEEVKWGVPCYTYNGTNIIMLAVFKDRCAISFLKGALMKDDKGLLVKPGQNTQAGRIINFTEVQQVIRITEAIHGFIRQAIEIEKKGLTFQGPKVPESIPEELQQVFSEDPELESAFFRLTPGRQRGYLIHFNGAKQSKTRFSRIEKFRTKIMAGKGFHDR